MTNDAKRTSQLGIATTLSANDRVVVLTNPATAAQTQTISVTNFAVTIASNGLPIANSTQLGVIKIGPGLAVAANGVVTAPLPIATTSSVGVVKVGSGLGVDGDGTIYSTVNVSTGSISFTNNTISSNSGDLIFNSSTGVIQAIGNIIPSANNTYTLGNTSHRWNALYLSGNSVVFADQNPTYPDQILTVANGVFYIADSTNTAAQSNAGFNVGNFLFQNNYIAISNSSANIYIGTTLATGNLVINRPIVVNSPDTGLQTFGVLRNGRVQINTPVIPANDPGALNIVGSSDGSYVPVRNPGGMLHITGNDGQPTRLSFDNYSNTGTIQVVGRKARGSAASPQSPQAGDSLFRIAAAGWLDSVNQYAPLGTTLPTGIEFFTKENFGIANQGSITSFYNAPLGSNVRTLSASIDTTGLTLQASNSHITFTDGSTQNTAFNSNSAVTRINAGVGLIQSANTGIVGIDSTAVLSLAGTANQVSVANVGGNYTLSLPQNIATTSNVQFNTLTVTNLTVTGTSSIANSAAVANAVLNLAYNSSNSSQIDNGGITLGNTSSSYYVSIKYNLSNNAWTTGNTNFITNNLKATANVNANVGYFTGQVHAGAGYIGYDYPNATLQVDCNINSYNQVVQQNHNGGTQSSSDFVAVNDIGNDSNNYIDMGINSSTYANNLYNMGGPNDGYLYVNGGNLDVATQSQGTYIQFFTGNTTSDALRATINATGLAVVGNVTANYFIGNVTGSANSASYIGTVSAANVVSNAQLIANLAGYQTTAGLASNVATLTSNLATYIVANTGLVSNSSGVFVNSAYIDSIVTGDTSGFQTKAGLAANVATLTANNTSYVGLVTAANVVSNAQLIANLSNYQTTAGLAANVATLTSNNTSFVGTVSAANVVSNAQLIANLSNYITLAVLNNYQTTAGLASNVATLAANSASYIGTLPAANVVSNNQLQSNLANYVTTTNLNNNLANYVTATNLVNNLANYQTTAGMTSYQTTAGLSANVLTLTSNNTSFVGTVSAANVVSNAQLTANLSNYQLISGMSAYQTTAGLASNVVTLTANNTNFVGTVSAANVVSNAQLVANLSLYGTLSGEATRVAALTANNTNFVGTVSAANVVSNAQLSANLSAYQTTSGLNSNVAALGYTNTSSSYTITGVHTHNANLVIGTTAGISANGSYGTAGQRLTSNGSSVYWANDIPQYLTYCIDADRTLATSNSVQSLFGVGVTLASDTKYRYFICGTVYKTNTSFTSTGAMQFAITNTTATAVLGRNYYVTNPCAANSSQTTLMNAQQMSLSSTSGFRTVNTITNANTGATWYNFVIDGTMDVTTGGTLNPQIAFTHTGGLGTGTVLLAGATFELWPIGNATSNAVIGTWA